MEEQLTSFLKQADINQLNKLFANHHLHISNHKNTLMVAITGYKSLNQSEIAALTQEGNRLGLQLKHSAAEAAIFERLETPADTNSFKKHRATAKTASAQSAIESSSPPIIKVRH